jgi:hypothetical protein
MSDSCSLFSRNSAEIGAEIWLEMGEGPGLTTNRLAAGPSGRFGSAEIGCGGVSLLFDFIRARRFLRTGGHVALSVAHGLLQRGLDSFSHVPPDLATRA